MQPCQPRQKGKGLPIARKALRQLLFHLTPARCVVCRKFARRHISLCHECESDLKTNTDACESCARPLEKKRGGSCGACQKNPPYYDSTHAPLLYKDAAKTLLIELKFREKLLNARIIGGIFTKFANIDTCPDLLIPVPLHSGRLRERGYNQSLEIAREIAAAHKIPVDWKSCERRINTARQSELPIKQRRSNVKNAFQSHRRFDGLHIVIVDDVMTSGNTVNELAKVLKKSGARRVDAWVMARA